MPEPFNNHHNMVNTKVNLLLTLLLLLLQWAVPCSIINAYQKPNIIHKTTISLYGKPQHTDGFTHFRYTNPNAPKGGLLKLSNLGSFNTFNPFNNKGTPPVYIAHVHDRLMVRSWDINEPYTLYPLIAESLEYPPDFDWVAFNLNPNAQFHDQTPITAHDVVFTFNLLKKNGLSTMQAGLLLVNKAVVESPQRAVFYLDKERGIKTVALLGLLPVLQKKSWEAQPFENTYSTPPVGSGPIRIESFELGKSIQYSRVENYWGKDLPVNQGQFNFDDIKILYFRDANSEREAFKTNLIDYRIETDLKIWNSGYKFPAIRKGQVICESYKAKYPPGRSCFVLNLRNPVLKNIKVRQALHCMFDQQKMCHLLQQQGSVGIGSYFTNTPLAAIGLPSEEEKKLLLPFKKYLPEQIFSSPIFTEPDPEISWSTRKNRAIMLLQQAGYIFKNNHTIHKKTNKKLSFQVIIPSLTEERIIMLLKKDLSQIGIHLQTQTIDASQYILRIKSFNYDIAYWNYYHSVFPGPELNNFWRSPHDTEDSCTKFSGVSNPAIDALLDKIQVAKKYTDLITPVKALDRTLRWHYYTIPTWYNPIHRIAHWNHIKFPENFQVIYHPWVGPLWHADYENKKNRHTL